MEKNLRLAMHIRTELFSLSKLIQFHPSPLVHTPDPVAEYCDEVPRAGKTIMVVDVTPGELREVPMSLEVVAASDSGQSRTILSVPAKIYERGIADTEVVLNAGSDYLARVALELRADREPQLLSFPIRVAAWYRALIMPALIVAVLLALTATIHADGS